MDAELVLNIAFAMQSNPGAYALLLGSGLSRSAGVPTGWEIVLDLITRLATALGENAEPDLETWYRTRFYEDPDYSRLLAKLLRTPADRAALMRSYFEPTEDERQQGLKAPTLAHRSIAKLVQLGYVRTILTTNFDRLLQTALAEVGVTPNVVSSDDALKGAVPYTHSRCFVLKIHGDYLDTRIKNTTDELGRYSPVMNRLLDRVLDEFGLVICGWSGTWDTALRQAILRCSSHRFATYWLTMSPPTTEAQQLIELRRADIVKIRGADSFFSRLLEQVISLQEIGGPRPLSVAAAVATVKRYIPDPLQRIRLFDLVREETEETLRKLNAIGIASRNESVTIEVFQRRLAQYEAATERLIAMLVTLAYWDEGSYSSLLTYAIERLLQVSGKGDPLANFRFYPALLATYASGIASIAANRPSNLSAVLLKPQYREPVSGEKGPAARPLYPRLMFGEQSKWIFPDKRRYTPESDRIFDVLRALLRPYLPDDGEYEEAFAVFEYVFSLNYIDLTNDRKGPLGQYRWRYTELAGEWEKSPIARMESDGLRPGENWPLLKAGFFGGSVERYKKARETHMAFLNKVLRSG